MDALALLARWPATAAAAVVMPDGSVVRHGDTRTVFELASVTKLVTAMAALVAHEEGTLPLDDIDARSGASVADLLAHSAGHDLDAATAQAHRRRRIYSTAAYERIGTLVHERSGLPFSEYLRIGVTEPLSMDTFSLLGSPGAAGRVPDRGSAPGRQRRRRTKRRRWRRDRGSLGGSARVLRTLEVYSPSMLMATVTRTC